MNNPETSLRQLGWLPTDEVKTALRANVAVGSPGDTLIRLLNLVVEGTDNTSPEALDEGPLRFYFYGSGDDELDWSVDISGQRASDLLNNHLWRGRTAAWLELEWLRSHIFVNFGLCEWSNEEGWEGLAAHWLDQAEEGDA
jgi:hypothetical protein